MATIEPGKPAVGVRRQDRCWCLAGAGTVPVARRSPNWTLDSSQPNGHCADEAIDRTPRLAMPWSNMTLYWMVYGSSRIEVQSAGDG